MASDDLQKELARKLIWAVTSTLAPPAHTRKRIRAWGWRLAGKMLAAKEQFTLTNDPSSRHALLAGGGVDGVSTHAGASDPSTPLFEGESDGPTNYPCGVRPAAVCRKAGVCSTKAHSGAPCCSRRDCWWGGSGSLWRPTGCDDRWRRWFDAAETQAKSIDRRRYADGVDDSLSHLKKGCRELHTAAYSALMEGHFGKQCVL
jgi:hypothetical protein